jgi:hypothetical protein|tara:strand:- start:22 stop:252 length:231 start_codon:yes stop_codon:yes gene_type:complete
MKCKDLKPGKLIEWKDGSLGVLGERVDIFTELKISSRNYSPRWHWKIYFLGPPPPDYNPIHGIHESIIEKYFKILD